MAGNNPQPLGADSENFYNEYYDNSSQQLKRHVYVNNRGEYDHDIADFIFKKAGYTCTYIVIHTTGIPDGVILKLCDENSNQLYSPVDTNNNWITTACSITVGETDIIPLPAQFDSQLSNHVPFPIGTYNWKLIFAGNSNYKNKELPLTVEIRDFKVWDIQTPTIYPNEGIKVKVQTNANTLYPPTFDMSPFLTNNATYDYETGIITYPISDINTNIGKHMQVINQSNNCFIDYEVKNPIEFYHNGNTEYGSSQKVGYIIKQPSLVDSTATHNYNILINGQNILTQGHGGGTSPLNVYNVYTNHFPPGVYHCVIPTISTTNGQQYTCEGTFTISTNECHLYTIYDSSIKTVYLHGADPIINAKIGLIDIENNALIETATTDSSGQITWNTSTIKNFKAVAIDYDNNYILESNSLYHSLSVTGPNIIQKNENISIKAKLLDYNDNPIKDATINFYKVVDE